MTGRANAAIQVADDGLAINPNSNQLYGARSSAEVSLGRFEEAKSDALQSIRLSPRDPQVGLRYVTLGDAEVGLGHLDAAVEEYEKAIDIGYRNRVVNLAGVYALQGRMDEAHSVLSEALSRQSQADHQDANGAFSGSHCPRRRAAQGGACAGMSQIRDRRSRSETSA
jgi:tetratricopeptide (TPR) repeat protein